MDAINSNDIILKILSEKCKKLSELLSGEVMLICAPMHAGIDDFVRQEIENLCENTDQNHLVIVLETTGGSIEVVERLNDVFRHHFNTISFIIPNFAYSAGTVLTLSGDEIYMDYYSVLGPIDPQIPNNDGRWVAGIGYLEKYNDLIEKSQRNEITAAELEILIRKFDPALLFGLEQARNHSTNLIEGWLYNYKFKNWTRRETSGKKVEDDYKKERAKNIAELLGDPTEWNSHGRGIPLRVLESEKIRLKINNFGEDKKLNAAIREYYDLFKDYCGKNGVQIAVHTTKRFLPLGG